MTEHLRYNWNSYLIGHDRRKVDQISFQRWAMKTKKIKKDKKKEEEEEVKIRDTF